MRYALSWPVAVGMKIDCIRPSVEYGSMAELPVVPTPARICQFESQLTSRRQLSCWIVQPSYTEGKKAHLRPLES